MHQETVFRVDFWARFRDCDFAVHFDPNFDLFSGINSHERAVFRGISTPMVLKGTLHSPKITNLMSKICSEIILALCEKNHFSPKKVRNFDPQNGLFSDAKTTPFFPQRDFLGLKQVKNNF
ncbi:MAG: hypothetical protein GY938_07885 [Ketobacter sp.]|nr:hypothetical protein [Ketobacter sp.]